MEMQSFGMPGLGFDIDDQEMQSFGMPSTSHGYDIEDQKPSITTIISENFELINNLVQREANENGIPELFKFMEKYLPGHKFVPTDDQLITRYLRKKIANEPVPPCLIRDVNLYQHHPKDLAEYPRHDSLIDEWYFFSPRDRKYPNGSRPNRAAGNGYWKATGADKAVKVDDETVGFKQALVYYEGKPPDGEKTNWIMHEYKDVEKRQRISNDDMKLDDWVLCRLYYKKVQKPLKKEEEEEEEMEKPLKKEEEEEMEKEEECPPLLSAEANQAEDYIGYFDDIILKDLGSDFSNGSFEFTNSDYSNGNSCEFTNLEEFDSEFD